MKTRLLLLALGVTMSLNLALTSDACAQQRLLIAGNFAVDHSSTAALEVFKDELERQSNGELVAQIFPAMQTGGASENVTAVRQGSLFMTVVGMPYLSRIVPELEAVSLPFLFPTREIAFEVVDGPVGDALAERMAESGFVLFPMMELGYRHVTNNVRPIRSVADIDGLKIRLQPSETHLATFEVLGASPQPMDVKELYSALQQGVLDGQENPYGVILTWRFQEVQKYLSNTGHFFDFILIVANKNQFDALKPEFQNAVRAAIRKAVEFQRQKAIEADNAALAELQQQGMQYDELSLEVKGEMRKATAGVVDKVKKKIDPGFVDRVLIAVEEASN